MDFDTTPFKDVYKNELAKLAYLVRRESDALFSELAPIEGKEYIRADTTPFTALFSILSNASKIQELVSSSDRGSKEQKEFHKSRSQALRKMLEPAGLSEMLQKKVRNTVEHFAEYLDTMTLAHTKQQLGPKYMAAFDFVISSWKPRPDLGLPFVVYELPGQKILVYPIRVYVVKTRTFYNMDWSVNIKSLRNEANRILQAIGKPHTEVAEDPREIATMVVCVPGQMKTV